MQDLLRFFAASCTCIAAFIFHEHTEVDAYLFKTNTAIQMYRSQGNSICEAGKENSVFFTRFTDQLSVWVIKSVNEVHNRRHFK